MDFLQYHLVHIDLQKRNISIQEGTVRVSLIQTYYGLARTKKDITIPAGSQINIEVHVPPRKSGDIVLLEPISN